MEEGEDEGGTPTATIKQGTAKGRIPSATDPEVRHGRKSKAKRFNGHKASVGTDVDSGIIVALDVLSGDAPDSTGALGDGRAGRREHRPAVEETLGDCAYGSGETRQAFADAQRVLIAKVPQENRNGGLFPKSAFTIDREERTATCPGGHTTEMADDHAGGGRTYYFDEYCPGCPLRAQLHDVGSGALAFGAPAGGPAAAGEGVPGHTGGEGQPAAAGDRGERSGAALAPGDRAGPVPGAGDDALPADDGEHRGQPAQKLEMAERADRRLRPGRRRWRAGNGALSRIGGGSFALSRSEQGPHAGFSGRTWVSMASAERMALTGTPRTQSADTTSRRNRPAPKGASRLRF